MDEITLFRTLRPASVTDAGQARSRAARKLDQAIATGEPRRYAGPPRRRHRPVAAALATVLAATGIAIAVPAVLDGSGGPLLGQGWAMESGSDGTIVITLTKSFHDQARLQHALRAAGVPAYVRSTARCAWEPRGAYKYARHDPRAIAIPADKPVSRGVIIIHPAAIPKGYAVFIGGYADQRSLSLQNMLIERTHPPVCNRFVPPPAHSGRH